MTQNKLARILIVFFGVFVLGLSTAWPDIRQMVANFEKDKIKDHIMDKIAEKVADFGGSHGITPLKPESGDRKAGEGLIKALFEKNKLGAFIDASHESSTASPEQDTPGWAPSPAPPIVPPVAPPTPVAPTPTRDLIDHTAPVVKIAAPDPVRGPREMVAHETERMPAREVIGHEKEMVASR
jgi:hypothetical protein